MSNATNLTHSYGNGTGYGNATLLADPSLCTLQTCDLSLASFLYLPTVAGNALYAGIFGAYVIGQLYFGIKYKIWGYMVPMIMGLILEIIGYIARVLLNSSPFDNDDFLMYLVTLTIAPAFMTAAIYLCLSRIVIIYGTHLSRFKPRTYTIVFVTCDLISLILQAVGGAIASGAKTQDDSDLGKNIMLAGLGFQVFSLLLFSIAAGEFALRVWKGKGTWNPRYLNLVSSAQFKSFILGLIVASATIFARCIYRCIELSGGFEGELFVSDEPLYMVLEGVMIIIACTCLTFLHPGPCFQGTWHQATVSWQAKEKLGIDEDGEADERLGGQESTIYEGMLPGTGVGDVQEGYSNVQAD